MAVKIKFELGPAAIGLIAVAAVIGYILGSSFPFSGKGLPNENPTVGQITPRGYGQVDIKRWATEIGMDSDQFNNCFDSKSHLQEIQLEHAQGLDVGVSGTPAFLIGNHKAGFAIVTRCANI
jgi:2-hydroxychromene-2-carboxylate isomerase